MLERLIEDWLDNASERVYQLPFCNALTVAGYRVVHMTRHCGMELGKDVIAIAPDSTVYAFQLKDVHGGRLKLSEWRLIFSEQVNLLTTLRIVHPAIPPDAVPRCALVVNGYVDEEVSRGLDDYNAACKSRGRPDQCLEIWTKDKVLPLLLGLRANFWPQKLEEARRLISLYISDGREDLDKGKLSRFLMDVLQLHSSSEALNERDCIIASYGAAALCAFALAPYYEKDNWFSQIEGWTVAYAHVAAVFEKNRHSYESAEVLNLIESFIGNALANLLEEINTLDSLTQGSPFSDVSVMPVRKTLLTSLAAVASFWPAETFGSRTENLIESVISKTGHGLFVWGEYSIPQFLAFYFFRKHRVGDCSSDALLMQLLKRLLETGETQELKDPYCSWNEAIIALINKDSQSKSAAPTKRRWYLDTVWKLFVRLNWKQAAKGIWPEVTHFSFEAFRCEHRWQQYLWHSDHGIQTTTIPKRRQEWSTVKQAALETKEADIPPAFLSAPHMALIFSIVYPHRGASLMLWLDSKLKR